MAEKIGTRSIVKDWPKEEQEHREGLLRKWAQEDRDGLAEKIGTRRS